MAKKYHPDRVPVEDKSVANEKFNVIHQAYTILTNKEMKERYDAGDSEVLFSKKTRTGLWERHMKVLADDDIQLAAEKYKNSPEEKEAFIRETIIGNGSMIHLMNHIPFMRVEDQNRILSIIKWAMYEKKIPNEIKIKKNAK